MLVRLRLVGGRVSSSSLRALSGVAGRYGDGKVYVTSRANLQVRGLPALDGGLRPDVLAEVEATGLVPVRTHELVRNVLVSPQTGLSGGRADLRPVAAELDRLLCADLRLSELPGRFLFALDDGRGDLMARECDLGAVVLDERTAQLRIGASWGPVVPLASVAGGLVAVARRFLQVRGSGPTAPWHVVELPEPLAEPAAADPRLPDAREALPYGEVAGGRHVAVTGSGLDATAVAALTAQSEHVVVTPWRGVLVPEPEEATR